jgi:hypothetical protein
MKVRMVGGTHKVRQFKEGICWSTALDKKGPIDGDILFFEGPTYEIERKGGEARKRASRARRVTESRFLSTFQNLRSLSRSFAGLPDRRPPSPLLLLPTPPTPQVPTTLYYVQGEGKKKNTPGRRALVLSPRHLHNSPSFVLPEEKLQDPSVPEETLLLPDAFPHGSLLQTDL